MSTPHDEGIAAAKQDAREMKYKPASCEAQHLSQLIGWKVVGVCEDPGECKYSPGPICGLVLEHASAFGAEENRMQRIAWVLCDPEGNGAGYLDIEREK